MLVEKKRLIELVSHDDQRVKNAALDALEQFFPGSDDVFVHLLKIVGAYGYDSDVAFKALRLMKKFIPTDDDVKKILRLYFISANEKSDFAPKIKSHLEDIISEFPLQLLDNNYNTISTDKNLLEIYDAVKEWEKFQGREPEDIWQELTELCNQNENAEMDGNDHFYCLALVTALSQNQKREKIKDKVITYLSQTTDVNYYLENFLVQLAGDLKLEETIPYLFRILIESHSLDFVHSSCIGSLGNIGTPEVVNEIGLSYNTHPDLRTALAEILRYIPYDYSEEMAIRLLQKETEPEEITFLALSLCNIFSIKSSEMILEIIRTKKYDPIITWLLDNLIPVYAYHNKTLDNLAILEKEDGTFREEVWEKSSFNCLLKDCQYCNRQKTQENCEPNYNWEIKIVMPRNRIPSKKKNKKKR